MSRSAARLRVRSPKIFLVERIGIPPPPSHAAAAPAASVSGAAAWLLPCLVFAPLPLRSWFRRSCGAAAAAAAVASGSRAAAVPSYAAARGGGGLQAWVRSRLPVRLSWARAMRPPLGSACGRSLLPCLVLGASRPALCAGYALSAWVCRCRAAAPRLVLGASRPAPLSSAAVLPAAACSRYAVTQPPLPNCTKTHKNCTEKRQKARFLCGISPQASLYASMDSTPISPM